MKTILARASGRYLIPTSIVTATLIGLELSMPSILLGSLATLALVVLLFMLWFFRDPERVVADGVVSPADGKVIYATTVGDALRLAIFMTPVSVHVNRAPIDGRIEVMEYHQGAHVPAFNKESEKNERLELDIRHGKDVAHVKLIAGTVARRIHPYLDPGVEVKKGDRLGLIAFGSRCELVLPARKYRFVVGPGAWVKAGSTTVAHEVA